MGTSPTTNPVGDVKIAPLADDTDDNDEDRVTLAPLTGDDALRALLATPRTEAV